MRKIDEVAQNYFDGDVKKALRYIMENKDLGPFSDYEDELTPEESIWVLNQAWEILIDIYGSEEKIYEKIKIEDTLEELNLTESEVKNAPKNPYKAELLKSVLKMLIMNAGVITLSIMGVDPSTLGFASSVANGLLSMTIGTNLINYCKYKKVKKLIDKQQNFDEEKDVTYENEAKGRGR